MKIQPQTVAILIDGGFFLKRYSLIVDPARKHTPEQVLTISISAPSTIFITNISTGFSITTVCRLIKKYITREEKIN